MKTNILCYEINEVSRFTVTEVSEKGVGRHGTYKTMNEAIEFAQWAYAVDKLKMQTPYFEEALKLAKPMFDLYCANPFRDGDYWHSTGRADLNFCCYEDGNCSVTLYPLKNINGTLITDTDKFMTLLERKCDAYTERGETIAFQSTVDLKAGTYNLTIKEG